MPYEDIHFQLVDLPAISPEHPVPWIARRAADGGRLSARRGSRATRLASSRIEALHEVLRERRVTLTERWEPEGEPLAKARRMTRSLRVRFRTCCSPTRRTGSTDPDDELEVFRELTGLRYPALAVSAATGHGLGEIGSVSVRQLAHRARLHQDAGPPPDRQHGRSRCAEGRPWRTLRGSSTRIWCAR